VNNRIDSLSSVTIEQIMWVDYKGDAKTDERERSRHGTMTTHTEPLQSVLEAVGETPLVRVQASANEVPVFAKLESFNPGASIKGPHRRAHASPNARTW
jgi:cystathionine beta-synthase (acetylserine-dependent) (EC 4.2.1.-)